MNRRKLSNAVRNFYDRIRFGLSSGNSLLYKGIYRYFYSPSKDSISFIVNRYSLEKGSGFTVIQIGANDGLINDPINKFIKRDSWNGVLLEPQSFVFNNYLSKVYKKDRGITLLNAALGEKDGSAVLYKIGFCNDRWAHGLASFNREILEKSVKSGYARRKAIKEGIEIPEEEEKLISEEEVTVLSPSTLMKENNINNIDLLQIDTEGFDFEVIKMFDIAKTRPSLISFESLHLSKNDYHTCISHLNNNGYLTKTIDANTIAMLNPQGEYLSFFKTQ